MASQLTAMAKAGLEASLKEAAASSALVFVAFQTTPELAKLREAGLDSVRKSFPPAEAIAAADAGELAISEGKSLKIALKLKYADADTPRKPRRRSKNWWRKVPRCSARPGKDRRDSARREALRARQVGPGERQAVAGRGDADGAARIDATIGELAEIGMSMAPMFMPGGPPKGPPPAPKQVEKK